MASLASASLASASLAIASMTASGCWAPPRVDEPSRETAEVEVAAEAAVVEVVASPRPEPTAERRERPPPVVPPPRPLANFTRDWSVDDPVGLLAVIDADAEHLVLQRYVDGGHEFVLHDLTTGGEVGRGQAAPGVWARRHSSPRLVDRSTLLVLGADGLRALEVPDLFLRWRVDAELYDALGPERAAGGSVLMQLETLGILVRDLETGRERWRNDERTPTAAPSLLDESRIYLHTLSHQVIALDVRTGEERWRQPLPGQAWDHHWQLVFSGAEVLAVGDEVLAFDRATGAIAARYPAGASPSEWHHPVARGGALFLASAAGLEALDAATGAAIWSQPLALGDLSVSDDAIYGCGDGIVRALDVVDGAERWRFGLDHCQDLWPGDLPWFKVATGTARGDRVIVRTRGGVSVYSRGDAPPDDAEDVTVRGTTLIHGRPRARVAVRVGDQLVRSDARGRFTATLPAMRGVVTVLIDADEVVRRSRRPCASDTYEVVVLTGAGVYEVEIDGHGYDYECDRACRCD